MRFHGLPYIVKDDVKLAYSNFEGFNDQLYFLADLACESACIFLLTTGIVRMLQGSVTAVWNYIGVKS